LAYWRGAKKRGGKKKTKTNFKAGKRKKEKEKVTKTPVHHVKATQKSVPLLKY